MRPTSSFAALLAAAATAATISAAASPSRIVWDLPPGWTALENTDITPCTPPCNRVGNCGYSTPNPVCNVTLLIEICEQSCGCVSVNSNGWLKGASRPEGEIGGRRLSPGASPLPRSPSRFASPATSPQAARGRLAPCQGPRPTILD